MSVRRMPVIVVFIIAMSLLSVTARAVPEGEALPTPDELHKMFDDGQYQPLLTKLARVLQLRGNAAVAYDRVDLELLRADALLQLKQQMSAVSSVADAVKSISDQTDEKLAARAKATQLLFKRMQAFNFTPRTAAKGQLPQPISLLDMSRRKDAFNGLLADLRQDVLVKAKAAKAGKTLPPIIEAIRGVSDMRAVEMTATGAAAESQKLVDDLADQAKGLMGDALKEMKKRAKAIDDDANALIPNIAPASANGSIIAEQSYHKRGLEYNNTKELKGIIDTCTKVAAVSKDFADVSKSSAEGFKDIGDAAEKTAKDADTTLKADYSGSYGKR